MPRYALAVVIVTGIAAVGLSLWRPTRPDDTAPRPVRALSVTLPDEHEIVEAALSPDGTTLVYAAIADGRAQLFVRSLASFAVDTETTSWWSRRPSAA